MFGGKGKKSRFEVLMVESYAKDGGITGIVYVDTETGVQYFQACRRDAGGMTVLLDQTGKPLLHEEYRAK